MKIFCDILKTTLNLAALIAFGLVCGWCGWEFRTGGQKTEDGGQRIEYRQYTAGEQIRYLESQGYDCGRPKDKPGPKFCKALERWECDEYAKPWMKNIKKQIANSKNAAEGK